MHVRASRLVDFHWIESRTGCVLSTNAKAISCRDTSGRLRGMVAYDNWTQNGVQAHMVVDSPIVWRHLLRPAFLYPFEECGKGLLIGIIPSHNAASLAMTRAIGFRETYRIRDGWAVDDDLVIHEMRRDECRWLGQHGKAA